MNEYVANSWENAENGWLNKTVNEKITFFRILAEKSMCYTCGSRCLFPHQTFRRRRHVDGWLLLFCTRYSVPPFVNLVIWTLWHISLLFLSVKENIPALLLTCWLNFFVLLFSRLVSRSSFSSSIFSSVSHNSSALFSTYVLKT